MRPTNKKLYRFMTSCGGNWRNTIWIDSPDSPDGGFLIAFDRDAHPVPFELGKLRELSGEPIDPEECRARIGIKAAQDIFGHYLLWHTAFNEDSLMEG